MSELASRRTSYESAGLDVAEVDPDPMEQWRRWYRQAADAGCVEPNAFVLSTVGVDGVPQSRYLLARGADAGGFVFHTNLRSAKSREMDAFPGVSMLFTWLQLHRQVRITGTAAHASDEESDAYFASRPRTSQLGAWASPQSDVLPDRGWLDDRVAQIDATFGESQAVPRPAFWGGWRIRPQSYEFWQGRPSRLHDRVRYRPAVASDGGGGWVIERLAP